MCPNVAASNDGGTPAIDTACTSVRVGGLCARVARPFTSQATDRYPATNRRYSSPKTTKFVTTNRQYDKQATNDDLTRNDEPPNVLRMGLQQCLRVRVPFSHGSADSVPALPGGRPAHALRQVRSHECEQVPLKFPLDSTPLACYSSHKGSPVDGRLERIDGWDDSYT